MKMIKYVSTLVLFSLLALAASAQDAVVIDTGNSSEERYRELIS
ncbi:hypothetical protein [Pedobacter sp. NJ-S-72]